MLVLNRLCSTLTATRGVFLYDRKVICHSLELPWLGNIQKKSCIPTGCYHAFKTNHPRLGPVLSLPDVPRRSGILIHTANSVNEIEGCIAPGLDVSDMGVIYSRKALDRLYALLPNTFPLVIREA